MSPDPPEDSTGRLQLTRVRDVSPQLARAVFGSAPPWVRDFADSSYEWRRITAEVIGTFLLVLAATGAPVVAALRLAPVSHSAEVVAPALTVMAVILATGAVGGAHLNPIVSVAFALRQEFPWRRVPLYVLGQLVGALLASLLLWALFGTVGHLGGTIPAASIGDVRAMVVEAVLTFGLVTTVLGTASGAQNVGPLSALAVAGYVALAGLWAAPLSGASMNPVRTLAPDIVLGDYSHLWVYLVGQPIGMLIAVAIAYVLRGHGGDPIAARAAQGALGTLVLENKIPEDEATE